MSGLNVYNGKNAIYNGDVIKYKGTRFILESMLEYNEDGTIEEVLAGKELSTNKVKVIGRLTDYIIWNNF